MIYLVTRNRQLFKSEYYEIISLEKSIEIIKSWDLIQFDTGGQDRRYAEHPPGG